MYGCQYPWYELDLSLANYDGADAYTDVLEPWAARSTEERKNLARLATELASPAAMADEDVCYLYACFRVASRLLLRFQEGRADGTDYAGPAISIEGYQLFFESLGFRVPIAQPFHPFYHEILKVEQSPSQDSPIAVTDESWPALMLGSMMFCRAGVTVSGGAAHVVKDIAQRSKLYWTYWRKDRPYNDQSHGWGHNSQWRTQLRRDFLTPSGFHYNVDCRESLNDMRGMVDELDVSVMIELVRHRCMIRSSIDDSDLYPYLYSYMQAH